MQDSMFVGLDVHKATISIAVANGDRGGEVRAWGKIPNRPDHVAKLVEKLVTKARRLFFDFFDDAPRGGVAHRGPRAFERAELVSRSALQAG